MDHLDPHQRPPDSVKNVYKKYQKMKPKDLDQDLDIVDLPDSLTTSAKDKVRIVEEWRAHDLTAAFRAFSGQDGQTYADLLPKIPVYEHADMPGLHVVPNLLPPEIQTLLLTHLLHRDLSNPAHLTNIHTHYDLLYPSASTPDSSPDSFFTFPPTSATQIATPLDPTVHKPLTVPQLLNKKMRWTTLGGQYDWTAKQYPPTTPPPFPPDIKNLLESVWTSTKAEAAIVNLYSPGDTLSVHRDVAETSDTGLVSLSLGCDAIFVIGLPSTSRSDEKTREEQEMGEKIITLRLRSGSAVYMSGLSRFAWHGVPQIVKGTCPEYLADWPAGDGKGEYEEWRGWMSGKRVNLNVRQMWD